MYGDDSQYRIVPEQKNSRKNTTRTVWLLIAVLAAGVIGGAVSYFLLKNNVREMVESSVRPVVTMQTAAPLPSDASHPVPASASAMEAVSARTVPSVVEVATESKVTHPIFGSFITGGAGSGVIISEDGYIVTNHHVINDSTSITVRTFEGVEYPAKLVGTDQRTDLAVLKVDAQYLIPAVFGDSASVNVGMPVLAIGNPLGSLGGTVTEGIISAKDREILIDGDYMSLLQTSAAINPGNSGGGLFDLSGNLVGVVNAKSSGSDIEGLGFAIPVNTAKAVVTELIEHGYVTGRPALGVGISEIRSRSALYMYRLREPGVYITSAETSGEFQKWDRILQVEGTDIRSAADVKKIVDHHRVGDSLAITVRRNNRNVDITVILDEEVPAQFTGERV
ncbi:S1C family serine protease [Breznakiella homolactica]|uniref:Trypsin-like peptidase domain-containing protein n=1 Tax=Breznakiella homolactica TaxID=2798577 RepID=A0A7T7XR62_9SPIR|nr:trypsin-like peptidase domain-containing protein [Breznakiella homolactica]QQO10976.1 trypsin-like peptidase domain-containing protein [Breznakiella homolactica]